MRLSPVEAANVFIAKFFPNCNVAILGGSVVRGEATPNSDLDIVIIDELQTTAFRESFFEFDWLIEAFIHNKTTWLDYFESHKNRARPSLPRMCAEGVIIKDDGLAAEIQRTALDILEKGAAPWLESEINNARYFITDLLDDLSGSDNESENIFTVNKLSFLVHEFVLRVNGRWIGEGKWIVRALREFDNSLCESFVHTFNDFYKNGKKDKVVEFVDSVLEPYGGRLFKGFSLGKTTA